jgi:DNA-binding response OmpR family regulator
MHRGMSNAPVIGVRVLVADDDPRLLDMVCPALENFGADVTRAISGGELLDHMAYGERFDALVTDISMPWMTGLQVTHSAGLPVPIVIMTAMRDAALPQRVAELGVYAVVLYKPFAIDTLLAALRTCLESVAG